MDEHQAPAETATQTASHVEAAWKVADVCRFLGMKKSWVYEQMALNVPGGIPFKRLGSRVRFDAQEVRTWWRDLGATTQAAMRKAARERRLARSKKAE